MEPKLTPQNQKEMLQKNKLWNISNLSMNLVTQDDSSWNQIIEGAVRIDQAIEDLIINEQ